MRFNWSIKNRPVLRHFFGNTTYKYRQKWRSIPPSLLPCRFIRNILSFPQISIPIDNPMPLLSPSLKLRTARTHAILGWRLFFYPYSVPKWVGIFDIRDSSHPWNPLICANLRFRHAKILLQNPKKRIEHPSKGRAGDNVRKYLLYTNGKILPVIFGNGANMHICS